MSAGTSRAKAWWLAVSIVLGGVLGGVPGGTGGATIAEACQVVCACQGPGATTARARCEAECRAGLAGNAPPQECLECVVALDECSELETGCAGVCQ
jgi:hypothetical protein